MSEFGSWRWKPGFYSLHYSMSYFPWSSPIIIRYSKTWKKMIFWEACWSQKVSELEYPKEGLFQLREPLLTNDSNNNKKREQSLLPTGPYYSCLSFLGSTLRRNSLAQTFRSCYPPADLLKPAVVRQPNENQCLWGLSFITFFLVVWCPVLSFNIASPVLH